MIEIYSREGCKSCERVKNLMKFHDLKYVEFNLGVDVTSEEVRERFPARNQLPIVVTEAGEVFSGEEVWDLLNEYKSDFGKQMLNEEGQYDMGSENQSNLR